MSPDQDTIAAIATPIGQAGIGIIRVSGPLSLEIAGKIFRPKKPHASPQKPPSLLRASIRTIL